MGIAAFLCLSVSVLMADGLQDNIPESVRRIPKLGIEISDSERIKLQIQLDTLASLIKKIESSAKMERKMHLADIAVFHKAVFYALKHREFFLKNP